MGDRQDVCTATVDAPVDDGYAVCDQADRVGGFFVEPKGDYSAI